jgi:hypothetical protein
MLPWASFPKRFPTDVRLVPRNVALDAPRTGAFTRLRARRGHGRAFRPVVPPSPSRCVGSSVAPRLDDRATLRCDVPMRVASRCAVSRRAEAHPVTETVQQAPSGYLPGADSASGSAFLLDFDHLAKCGRVQSTVPGRRSASGPDILPVREAVGFRDSEGDTAPRIPRPLGQARKAAFNTYGTLPVPLSPPASLPSGSHFSPREHTWIRTGPSGALKSASLEPRSSERDTRLDRRGTFGRRPSGHRRPVHPLPATPKRHGSRVPGLAV